MKSLINQLSVKDFYALDIEDQGRITRTIIAVCKMQFETNSIGVAVRNTINETRFQKRLVDMIIENSYEMKNLVKAKKDKTSKQRQSCFSTFQVGLNAVS